jgi:hypothetical protein
MDKKGKSNFLEDHDLIHFSHRDGVRHDVISLFQGKQDFHNSHHGRE